MDSRGDAKTHRGGGNKIYMMEKDEQDNSGVGLRGGDKFVEFFIKAE
jgi:hypothetical protein